MMVLVGAKFHSWMIGVLVIVWVFVGWSASMMRARHNNSEEGYFCFLNSFNLSVSCAFLLLGAHFASIELEST